MKGSKKNTKPVTAFAALFAAWLCACSSSDNKKDVDKGPGCVAGTFQWGFTGVPFVELSSSSYSSKQELQNTVSFFFQNVPQGNYSLVFGTNKIGAWRTVGLSIRSGMTTKVSAIGDWGYGSITGPDYVDGCVQ